MKARFQKVYAKVCLRVRLELYLITIPRFCWADSWGPQRRGLGSPHPYRSDHCEVPEDLQIRRPCLVLPSRGVPALRLLRGGRRLGHRPQARERFGGSAAHRASQHRDRPLLRRNPPGWSSPSSFLRITLPFSSGSGSGPDPDGGGAPPLLCSRCSPSL